MGCRVGSPSVGAAEGAPATTSKVSVTGDKVASEVGSTRGESVGISATGEEDSITTLVDGLSLTGSATGEDEYSVVGSSPVGEFDIITSSVVGSFEMITSATGEDEMSTTGEEEISRIGDSEVTTSTTTVGSSEVGTSAIGEEEISTTGSNVGVSVISVLGGNEEGSFTVGKVTVGGEAVGVEIVGY